MTDTQANHFRGLRSDSSPCISHCQPCAHTSHWRRSHSELEVQSQQAAAELKVQYETAQKTAELLKIYKEGLLPQARAGFQAGIAAYQNNRQDFQSLLSSFLDVLHLDEEYWQNTAEREAALAQLEQLTGLSLQDEGAKR
jgi:cobalt-zinc-cadmium efflux system outer membrane protein